VGKIGDRTADRMEKNIDGADRMLRKVEIGMLTAQSL